MKKEMIAEPKRLLFRILPRSNLERSILDGWHTQYMLLNKYLNNK